MEWERPAPVRRVTFSRGYLAHGKVPPASWCVTKEDLTELRHMVDAAVMRQDIKPTGQDPFDPADNIYGPSVHTVVSQLLKPLCEKAGGSSWALMRHPDGLQCDLFVTHSWTEGIYEFIDKVVYSWPGNTKHAYCCMLSNPQCLNLGAFIASPSESPFAKALASATHVLVVPNRIGSIYERSWCTYEAYLAQQWNKTLLIATAPFYGLWWQILLWMLLCFIAGYLHIVLVKDRKHAKRIVDIYLLMSYPIMVAFMVVYPSTHMKHFVLTAFGLAIAGGNSALSLMHTEIWGTHRAHSSMEAFFDASCYGVSSAIVCLCFHIDCMWNSHVEKETAQLKNGYTGRIRDSKASVESDKRMILQEIRSTGKEAHVDEAISVLLKSGMSSQSLRRAHKCGVDISGVGIVQWRFIALCAKAFVFAVKPTHLRLRCTIFVEYGTVVPIAMSIAFGALWLLRFYLCFNSRDQRAFIAAAAWKLFGLPFTMYCVANDAVWILLQCRAEKDTISCVWYAALMPVFSGCAALLAMMDLGTVASIPYVGVGLARTTASNDIDCNLFRSCCCHNQGDVLKGSLSEKTVELAAM